VPAPRETGPGFEPYRWTSPPEEVAARHGISPAHVLRFDSNLPAFPAPLPSGSRAILAERADYPDGTYRELREAAAAYAGCDADEVAVDAGADGVLALVARTFLAPGRRGVVEEPTYPVYAIASRIEGARLEAVPRDLEELARAGRAAQVLWLCNPGNPSGELYEADEIASLADALPETLVCVDEAYYEYGGETTAPHTRERPNLVCVRTLSKAFGLAGLRVGYAVASRAVAGVLTDRRAPAPIANVAASLAAEALRSPAVAEGEALAVREERARLRSAFEAAGYDAPATHANFVVVRTSEAPELAASLERRGLVVRCYPGALRIGVRSPGDDDLLLGALRIEAPTASRRAGTVLEAGVRASIVLDGSGRVASRTGGDDRDRAIEERAAANGWDLEVVAEPGTSPGAIERALAAAEELATLVPTR
jgi:histidinol-phosphate aminotransferase